MRLLALRCATLMVAPIDARAAAMFQTGMGYVQGECRTIGDSDDKACFTGERFDLGLNFTFNAKDDTESKGGEAHVAPRHGGGGWSGWSNSWMGRDGAIVVVAVLVLILILYGIYWMIAGMLSNRVTVGLYATSDFQKAKLTSDGDTKFEKYHSQSAGIQTNFYIVRDTDIALNVGLAGTTAQIGHYNLRGYSSKAGIGYLPFERTGVYGMLEWEGTFFSGTSFSKYWGDEGITRVPEVRRSGAFILGLTF